MSPVIIRGVRGVVIGYENMRGVILLQHKSVPSLDDAVDRYRASPHDKHWFAKFAWKAVDESDRRLINGRPEAFSSSRGRRRKGKRKRSSIEEYLRGRVVVCTLEKTPKWEAIHVEFDFEDTPYSLPKKPTRSRKWPGNESTSIDIVTRRSVAAESGGNLRRPWGGMS